MEIWPQTPWGCLTDNSGERLNGIQEVSGSIPIISAKKLERVKKNLEII